jgi:hypothetical protein
LSTHISLEADGGGPCQYLCKLFSFGDLFVNLLGEVLVRLEDLNIRHCGEEGCRRIWCGYDKGQDVTEWEELKRLGVWIDLMKF